jgi:hypothetical protein
MGDPLGEAVRGALQLVDRRLMLQFRGSAMTFDAGLLAYRELDDTLGLTDMGTGTLVDARHREGWSPSVGRFAATIAIRTAGRIRGRK